MRTLLSSLLLTALFVPFHTPVGGQSIQGHILVEGDTLGVDGATVILTTLDGEGLLQVQSNDMGQFWLSLEEPGRYSLRVERIGFRSVRAPVQVGEREMVDGNLERGPSELRDTYTTSPPSACPKPERGS